MEIHIKDLIKMENLMDRVSIIGMTEAHTKEIS
jgi:hypothetical protein